MQIVDHALELLLLLLQFELGVDVLGLDQGAVAADIGVRNLHSIDDGFVDDLSFAQQDCLVRHRLEVLAVLFLK